MERVAGPLSIHFTKTCRSDDGHPGQGESCLQALMTLNRETGKALHDMDG